MFRPALRCIAALAFLGSTLVAHGQEPEPSRLTGFQEEGDALLTLAWRYHPGDDPRWTDPAFDDTGWEIVDPQMPPGSLPRHGWPGTGWFRRHLQIAPALQGKPLVICLKSPGATAVFLDGALLMDVSDLNLRTCEWRVVTFSSRPEHVLAVRHRSPPGLRHARGEGFGFLLSLEVPEVTAARLAAEHLQSMRRATLQGIFTAVLAFLALLHLALFLFYPKARENLFHGLTMAFAAGIVYFDLSPAVSSAWVDLTIRGIIACVLSTIFFALLTYYTVRTRAIPRAWIAFAAVGAALMSWVFVSPDTPSPRIWHLYFGLMLVEVIRVEATGRKVEQDGVKILLRGFTLVAGAILLQIFVLLGLAPPVVDPVLLYLFALLVFAMTMSLFLARSFGRTNRHLEQRLEEVHALSEQVLAQERAAHEQELHRRLLEAENARTAAEIEAARSLQLSMLPAKLPAVEGLETAAVMAPASEVGGDYYDFRITPDGSLVVAFGDATGHGVAAGIMVTAVKALFSALGGGESLSGVLAECDRVLREMQARPFHMCLALARLTPRSITISSAAMPPVLIHRAGSGAVEELGTGGRPIGSRLSGAWSEHTAPLAPGDTLLFASDGFAEQLDPADRPLGYEALAEVLRATAAVPAAELAERFLARVAAWRGEREQGDDVTFVVVRVTG
jgi:serine phosphatase RsbU (regulator of sigma subunit)